MSGIVLGVGHCEHDSGRIRKVVEEFGCSFEVVPDKEAALEAMKDSLYILLLPNRLIGSDENAGLDIIKAVVTDTEIDVPVMLISAIESAQQAAVAAGALPGFGKNQLETGEAASVLSKVLDKQ